MSERIEAADAEDLAERAAAVVLSAVRDAVAARGTAAIAVPGGRSPAAAFERLARADAPWAAVSVTLTDERLVPADHPAANAGLVRRTLLQDRAAAARFVPLIEQGLDLEAEARGAQARLADLPSPLDLVWLGVGADAHTASLFPGRGYDEACDPHGSRRAAAVVPDPLPPEAPFARVTLTLAEIARARRVLVAAAGSDKRAVLDAALRPEADTPIARVLRRATGVVTILQGP